MSKELPYFQFEPAQYLSGDIQLCSLEAQGVFINLLAIYWQRDCQLTLDQAKRRLKSDSFKELISENIIKLDDNDIIIAFLDEQYELITKRKKRLSDAGRKGAKAKKDKATLKPPLSQASATLKQPDKIRGDKKKEDNTFNFKQSLLNYGFDKVIVNDWLEVRKNKKATNSETAYNQFIKVVKRAEENFVDKDRILAKCVEKDWRGLEYSWLENIGMVKKWQSPI